MKMYRSFPRNSSLRWSRLPACTSSRTLVSAPQAENVPAIWSSSSVRSVTIRNVQSPGFLRSTLRAKNSIDRLLPEPCVCQKTPSRPRFSLILSTAAMARFTPSNWCVFPSFLMRPCLSSSNAMKFSMMSRNRAGRHVPLISVSRLTTPGSSSSSIRFHSLKYSSGACGAPTRLPAH